MDNFLSSTANTFNNLTATINIEIHKFLEKTTASTGETLAWLAANPVLSSIDKVIGLERFMTFLGQADTSQIEAKVNQLKAQYPQENSSQIAHRLIVQKTWEGGRVGLLTNIIPPIAALFLGVELIATTKLQTEMVYEIAAAYGLDLHEPARRGEVLAIFGLSLGADVLKTGLNIVEIIPGIGAVVGASTNAALLYVLGQTACRFYENKSQMTTISKQKTNADWQVAIEQCQTMDLILTEMVKATYPEEDWADILPTIQEISPSSVKAISLNLEQPQSLETLLNKLSSDFAPLTLSRCYDIATSNGEITLKQQKILSQIAIKFNLDMSTLNIEQLSNE
ncbi:MAG: YcjF family protein [Waterburya sp.]